MRVVYIAHPLGAGADRESNRLLAQLWVGFLALKFDIAPIADWIVLSGCWSESDAHRSRGLAIDLALVARADEVWMVGGRVSPGMKLESDEARRLGKVVVDLTDIRMEPPHDALATRIAERVERARMEAGLVL